MAITMHTYVVFILFVLIEYDRPYSLQNYPDSQSQNQIQHTKGLYLFRARLIQVENHQGVNQVDL